MKRVAIVGCGHISWQHLRALQRLPSVKVVAVCDSDLDRARECAATHHAGQAFHELDDLIEQTNPDVVHVLTPPRSHRALVNRALERGCHVIVEKPMAIDVKEAREMLEVADRHGRQIAVCHTYAFIPAVLAARRLVELGALGTITSADIYWRMSTFRPELRGDAVRWMTELPGGPMAEVLPHPVYLLQLVMPKLALVDVVTGGRLAAGVPAEIRAMFVSDAGPAVLGVSLTSMPIRKVLVIRGTAMTVEVDLATNITIPLRMRPDTKINRALTSIDHAWWLIRGLAANTSQAAIGRLQYGHVGLVKAVYDALARGAPIPAAASGESGVAAMEVVDDLCKKLA